MGLLHLVLLCLLDLLRLVLLCFLGHHRLRSEEAFAFIAYHVVHSKEKSRPCTCENIIKDGSGQIIFVRKWIMVLVGCDAIWPRESLTNEYEWNRHKHCTTN